MLKKYRLIPLIPLILIGSCTSEENKTAPTEPDKNHIFQDQLRALEKAKGVEQMLQNASDKRRKALEEQTR